MVDKSTLDSFQAALELSKDQQKQWGIGTLGEKPLHAVIKYTVEPNDSYHEIKIGSSVADVVTDGAIVEVQTRNLHSMKRKLSLFLEKGKVRLIHPIAAKKWLCWVDPDSGEVSAPKISPKKGQAFDSFMELMYIRDYLKHPNLTVELWLLEVEEYRFLDGYGKDKKKRSSRYQQLPKELLDIVSCNCAEDFLKLLPELPEVFTRKELKAAVKRSDAFVNRCLYTLEQLELVQRVGKEGNAILYKLQANTTKEQ